MFAYTFDSLWVVLQILLRALRIFGTQCAQMCMSAHGMVYTTHSSTPISCLATAQLIRLVWKWVSPAACTWWGVVWRGLVYTTSGVHHEFIHTHLVTGSHYIYTFCRQAILSHSQSSFSSCFWLYLSNSSKTKQLLRRQCCLPLYADQFQTVTQIKLPKLVAIIVKNGFTWLYVIDQGVIQLKPI